jgi:hypothetical protein
VKDYDNDDVIQPVLAEKPDEIKWESFVSCLSSFRESLSHGRCQGAENLLARLCLHC